MSQFIRRRREFSEPSSPGLAADSGAFREAYPALSEYLTCCQHEDGSPREPSSLSIFAEHGSFKACLNDRDTGEVAFFTADCALDLFEIVEAGLVGHTADWRVSKAKRGGRK
mgnify:CR=1 FL=1